MLAALRTRRCNGSASRSAGSDPRTPREPARACWLSCAVAVWVAAMPAINSLTLIAAKYTVIDAEMADRLPPRAPDYFARAAGPLALQGPRILDPNKIYFILVAVRALGAAAVLFGLWKKMDRLLTDEQSPPNAE